MARVVYVLGAVALLASAAACEAISGLDDFELATGAGGGGAASSSGTASSSTGTGGEDCLNGADDDGDGDVDCADADCSNFACVAAPDGWEGPVALYDGSSGTAPDCPPELPDFVADGLADPVQEDASCEACTCAAPAITCTPASLLAYGGGICGGVSTPYAQPSQPNMCQTINGNDNVDAYLADSPMVSAGPCVAAGGTSSVPPAKAGRIGRVCGAQAGGGCMGGAVCAPTSVAAPFEQRLCVFQAGDANCPVGFETKRLYATSLDDSRACTACSCGTASASCSITTTVYADSVCTATIAVVPNNHMCVPGNLGKSIMTTRTVNGSCPASGGQPTGSVTLGPEQVTVCCAP